MRYLAIIFAITLAGCKPAPTSEAIQQRAEWNNEENTERIRQRVDAAVQAWIKDKDETMSDDQERRYLDVINLLKTGDLSRNLSGTVLLPKDMADISTDGRIIVTRTSVNGLVVIFKTWAGKDDNMLGFMYTDQPLTKDELVPFYNENQTFTLHSVHYSVEPLKNHWYKVSFLLD